MHNTSYRADIEGLRAVAVVVVLLFHTDVGGCGGGFVGVDIFFVISGFLITRVVLSELDLGTVSLVCFYERRVRRILPALLVVLIVCLLSTGQILLPTDLDDMAVSAIATTLLRVELLFGSTPGISMVRRPLSASPYVVTCDRGAVSPRLSHPTGGAALGPLCFVDGERVGDRDRQVWHRCGREHLLQKREADPPEPGRAGRAGAVG